jgi:hypothetical protein
LTFNGCCREILADAGDLGGINMPNADPENLQRGSRPQSEDEARLSLIW